MSGRAQPASKRCDRPEPSHVVADHSRRAQQTATRTQTLNASACILRSSLNGRLEGRVRCGSGCRSCACHNATLSSLPRVLPFAGARPEWDDYLTGVYGALPPFPFRLDSLRWFYRCDCRLLNRNCRVSHAACNVPATIAEWQERTRVEHIELQKAWPKLGVAARGATDWRHERWRDSCRAGARVPLPNVLPKVWLGSLPSVRDGAVATREAFVGFKTNKWANPEFWLAPWGFWAGPFGDAPRCVSSHSWVEVMRVLQPAERRTPAAPFIVRAPASNTQQFRSAHTLPLITNRSRSRVGHLLEPRQVHVLRARAQLRRGTRRRNVPRPHAPARQPHRLV